MSQWDRWIKLEPRDSTESNGIRTDSYHFHKFTVPSNGYLKIQTNNLNGFNVYLKAQKNKVPGGAELENFTEKRSGKNYVRCVPIKKGTYYLVNMNTLAQISGDDPWIKAKCSFVKVPEIGNYSRKRAKTIARGKKQSIVFQPGNEFTRWYKFKLNQKKTITIQLTMLGGDAYNLKVYDAEGSSKGILSYDDDYGDDEEKKYTLFDRTLKLKLFKGTYYITFDGFLGNPYDYYSWNTSYYIKPGNIAELTWK